MRLHISATWAIIPLVFSLSGCKVYDVPPDANQQGMSTPKSKAKASAAPETQPVILTNVTTRTDLNRVRPGEYCELQTTVPQIDSVVGTPYNTSKIAGRVVLIDDTKIVLEETISIDDRDDKPTENAKPNKKPHTRRGAKNIGILVSPIAIPGEVAIPRSSIQHASKIDPHSWSEYRREGFQRKPDDFESKVAPQQ
jgi:hypothetical protein